MSNDTDRLEMKAEVHRSKVDSTLDELRARFSTESIIDEVASYLKDGQGSDMAKNLGRQVRENPLALGLVGAGIAWLFAGNTARSGTQHLRDRYDDWRDERDNTENAARREVSYSGGSYRTGRSDVTRYEPQNQSATSGTYRVSGSSEATDSSEPGLVDKAKSAISEAGSGLADVASRAGETISGAAGSARDTASRYGRDMSDVAWRGEQAAMRQARRAGRTVLDAFHDEPLIMGGIALALGAAVGAALPSTRREDELMGETRDGLRDTAYAYGRDTLEKAENVAGKTYQAMSDTADEKGLTPKGDGGETIAEKLGGVVKAATDTAKDEAKKEGLL